MYDAIKNNPRFEKQYGIKNAREMIAKLSQGTAALMPRKESDIVTAQSVADELLDYIQSQI